LNEGFILFLTVPKLLQFGDVEQLLTDRSEVIGSVVGHIRSVRKKKSNGRVLRMLACLIGKQKDKQVSTPHALASMEESWLTH